MSDLSGELDRRIARLASDRESGASDILDEAIRILTSARDARLPIPPVAKAICQAQPSMASLWNAALEAVASERDPGRFDRFVQRVARSRAGLARFAVEFFASDADVGPLRLVTISASRTVWTVFEALRPYRQIHVSCSESRPAGEGRGLAARLATTGVPVTLFSDAAIAHALSTSDAVVVGADAVCSDWFLNKSGTRMLAAAAAQLGVPVYVAATRDKFVGPPLESRLLDREGAPAEIWESPPPGVEVRNPYFESTPLDLVTTVITDVGVLGVGMVPDVCSASADPAALQALLAPLGARHLTP